MNKTKTLLAIALTVMAFTLAGPLSAADVETRKDISVAGKILEVDNLAGSVKLLEAKGDKFEIQATVKATTVTRPEPVSARNDPWLFSMLISPEPVSRFSFACRPLPLIGPTRFFTRRLLPFGTRITRSTCTFNASLLVLLLTDTRFFW